MGATSPARGAQQPHHRAKTAGQNCMQPRVARAMAAVGSSAPRRMPRSRVVIVATGFWVVNAVVEAAVVDTVVDIVVVVDVVEAVVDGVVVGVVVVFGAVVVVAFVPFNDSP
jgi:hypothetical protein